MGGGGGGGGGVKTGETLCGHDDGMKRCGLALLLLVASPGCSGDERASDARPEAPPWTPLLARNAETGCEGEAVARPVRPTLTPIDGLPLSPLARVVDHVAQVEATRGAGAYSLTRRGDWLRKDATDRTRVSTTYANISTGASLLVSNDATRQTSILVVQPQKPDPGTRYRITRAGGLETVAGEPCDRWRVVRRLSSGARAAATACITSDGIELRQAAYADWDTPHVFRTLERRCVAAAEVTPPMDLVDIRPRLGLDDPGPKTGAANYEVVLEATEAEGVVERWIVRRRGAVVLTDIWSSSGQRRISISNEARGLSWWTGLGPDGRAGDMVFQQGPPEDRRRSERPRMPDRPESWILGEACHWLGDNRAVHDASSEICETDDGITLIITRNSWGQRPTLRAVRLTRGGVTRDEVSPPAEIMTPGYWGFPDA